MPASSMLIHGEGAPPVPGVSRTEAGQQDPGSQTSTDPAGRGAEPRRTMPDPRLMLLVCQTLMPDLGRTRPDAAPDAGPRPRTPAGSQPGLPAQGRVFRPGAGGAAYGSFGRGGGIHPSLLAGSRVRGGDGSSAAGGDYGRARPARIPRGTPRRAMQSFEYRSVRYWSKEINGTLTGGRKK